MTLEVREELLIDLRLTIPEAENLVRRLKDLKCGDPSELYRYDVGKLYGKKVVFVVGLKQ